MVQPFYTDTQKFWSEFEGWSVCWNVTGAFGGRAAEEAIVSLHLDAIESSCCQQLPSNQVVWTGASNDVGISMSWLQRHQPWVPPSVEPNWLSLGHFQQNPRCSEQHLSATVTHRQLPVAYSLPGTAGCWALQIPALPSPQDLCSEIKWPAGLGWGCWSFYYPRSETPGRRKNFSFPEQCF